MFLDKRIGEKDSNLSAEDKMIARFTAERVKGSGKSSIFNLGDDFNLTHGGAKLSDIDKFDDPKSDEDEDMDSLLNKDFVDEAHFGGFMTKSDEDFKAGKGNSRKEIIENLIRESKKKKAEKRKADEEAEEKAQELDDNWRDMLKDIAGGKLWNKSGKNSVHNNDDEVVASYDPYDMLVKSLGYEKKEARPSERLKTEDEKIKDEKERLQKLEEDRLRRMRGETEFDPRQNFSVEDMGEEGSKKSIKLNRKERRQLEKAERRREAKEDDNDNSEDESGDDEDGEADEGEEEEEEEDADEDDDEQEDNYSDLNESDAEEEEKCDGEPMNEKDLFDQEVVEMMDKASKELPYAIEVHDSYESFSSLVWNRSAAELETIFERILATNHPSVTEDKLALVPHYQHLLQYIQDLCHNFSPDLVQVCVGHLTKLTGLFQQAAASCLLQVCVDKQQEFSSSSGRARYPGLDTVLYLHLLHLGFPTSDYRHPVTTPATTFITQILSSARPTDRASFASCISLAAIVLEYVTVSRRLVPELVNTLLGLVFVCSENKSCRPPPPCKGGVYLQLGKKCKKIEPTCIGLSEVNSVKEIDDEFRVRSLFSTLTIIIKLLKLYREIPSAAELFEPFSQPLANIKTEFYPTRLQEMLNQVATTITSLKRKKAPVVRPAKKVAMLRMLEPSVEESFDPMVKKRVGKKDLLEEQKMRHKLKQEKKGARKEIRQDTAFLANQKMREQRMKDADRQSRTKALFSNLATQEGDYKKLLKKKKKF